jgi:hypothetical protein
MLLAVFSPWELETPGFYTRNPRITSKTVRFGTNSQYLRHLADDVLPGIIEGAFSAGRRG